MSVAATTKGRFVWRDLMTTDVEAATAFYGALFGWRVVPVDMGPMGTYRMLHLGEVGIGGIVPLENAPGIPSHWISYITVDDVDASCEEIQRLGGAVCVPPTDIPDVGRFAVTNDPQGGFFSPFKGLHDAPEPEGPPPTGAFCWTQLLASDPSVAAFYEQVFGWGVQQVPLGDAEATFFLRNGMPHASLLPKPPDAAAGPDCWLPYVAVDDPTAAEARAIELGATRQVGCTEIPGMGTFAVFVDPTGALIAIWKNATTPAG
ncbi:MAG: VOC family protein [Planctomycetota bacterium]